MRADGKVLATAAVLLAAALAGCTGQPPPGGDGDGGNGAGPANEPTSVEVTSAPDSAEPGGGATVCWRVEGEGTIAHTALHFDNQSHPEDNASFGDYDLGAAYPDNRSTPAPGGYDLPGTFCTDVPVGPEDVYFRAHAMNVTRAPGVLGDEHHIQVEREDGVPGVGLATSVAFEGEPPGNATAGSSFVACWRVEGAGTVPHTAIHTDNVSHLDDPDATFQSYEGPLYWPNNETQMRPRGYGIPDTFCTEVQVPDTPGETLYLRSHVIDSTGPPGMMSEEEWAVDIEEGDALIVP